MVNFENQNDDKTSKKQPATMIEIKRIQLKHRKKIDNNFIDYHQHHVVVVVVILCMSNDFES